MNIQKPMTGITFGVFDVFHLGHKRLLENAKKECDHLIVAVHDDKLNIKNAEFVYTLAQRMEMVAAIKYVDDVISYERVDLTLADIDFDVLLHGPDQEHQFFQAAFEICENRGKDRKVIARTQGVSSTMLRHGVGKKSV